MNDKTRRRMNEDMTASIRYNIYKAGERLDSALACLDTPGKSQSYIVEALQLLFQTFNALQAEDRR